MSKLDDEIRGFKDAVKSGGVGLVGEFNNPTSTTVVMIARKICLAPALPWFLLGMSVEALGLSLQYMFGMEAYSLLDFLVAGILATTLYIYQNPKVGKPCSTP